MIFSFENKRIALEEKQYNDAQRERDAEYNMKRAREYFELKEEKKSKKLWKTIILPHRKDSYVEIYLEMVVILFQEERRETRNLRLC